MDVRIGSSREDGRPVGTGPQRSSGSGFLAVPPSPEMESTGLPAVQGHRLDRGLQAPGRGSSELTLEEIPGKAEHAVREATSGESVVSELASTARSTIKTTGEAPDHLRKAESIANKTAGFLQKGRASALGERMARTTDAVKEQVEKLAETRAGQIVTRGFEKAGHVKSVLDTGESVIGVASHGSAAVAEALSGNVQGALQEARQALKDTKDGIKDGREAVHAVGATRTALEGTRLGGAAEKLAARAAETVALRGAVRAGGAAARGLGRIVPGVNVAIAGVDVALAARTLADPTASGWKKGVAVTTAGLSLAAATNIPVVSTVAGVGAGLVSMLPDEPPGLVKKVLGLFG